MRNKLIKALYVFLGIVFWLLLWEILSSYVVKDSFIFPTPKETFGEFKTLLLSLNFYKTVFNSVGRILLGLIFGIILGLTLGFLSHYVKPFYYVISPAISVIRATPVASIIIILWFFISKISLPIIISLMMVTPIIWQSTVDAFNSRDTALYEVADAFELGFKKRFKLLVMPQIFRFLIPSVITSIGLSWKSGIAAEIITMAKNSIGREISNAKNSFYFAEMFAWTLSVIILSIILEFTIKSLIEKARRKYAKS